MILFTIILFALIFLQKFANVLLCMGLLGLAIRLVMYKDKGSK